MVLKQTLGLVCIIFVVLDEGRGDKTGFYIVDESRRRNLNLGPGAVCFEE